MQVVLCAAKQHNVLHHYHQDPDVSANQRHSRLRDEQGVTGPKEIGMVGEERCE